MNIAMDLYKKAHVFTHIHKLKQSIAEHSIEFLRFYASPLKNDQCVKQQNQFIICELYSIKDETL
jgi:hypothetical protein